MPTATIEEICTECRTIHKEHNALTLRIVRSEDYEDKWGDVDKLRGKQTELRTHYIQANASNSDAVTKCLAKCHYIIKQS